MCPSSTVTVEPLIVVLLTRPQLVVVAPDILVTASEKLNTMACRNVPPFPTRHSTPGVPVSGKLISNVPALPCFFREAARFETGQDYEGPVYTYAFIENKDVFGLTVNLNVFNLTAGQGIFDRTVYTGLRDTSPIAFVEHRRLHVSSIWRLQVRGSF